MMLFHWVYELILSPAEERVGGRQGHALVYARRVTSIYIQVYDHYIRVCNLLLIINPLLIDSDLDMQCNRDHRQFLYPGAPAVGLRDTSLYTVIYIYMVMFK